MPQAAGDDASNRVAQAEAVYELMNDEVSERMAHLRSAAERIETKASFLAGFTVTASAILLDSGQQLGVTRVGALVLFALAFASAVGALAVWRWEDPPHPDGIIKEYSKARRVDALAGIVGTKATAYARNKKRINYKAWAWYGAAIFLGLGLTLLLVAALT